MVLLGWDWREHQRRGEDRRATEEKITPKIAGDNGRVLGQCGTLTFALCHSRRSSSKYSYCIISCLWIYAHEAAAVSDSEVSPRIGEHWRYVFGHDDL